ncbi:MAG: preprotein translocase subunit SecE [Buchnera aphidicola (Brevicoryne brassicae)]|uniref:Protein translocase subunit SecE n=1 Tax=Buchnera aphidicola (Brevicoryne brassicae) TaxID=911343 RepID=A0AAJ5PUE4_9GAMM|nr:preprotein translocase subunit SecE [Buchnera aphidicola]QCI19629.1 preprotein translocase subunit SecE [Buchnera aphidicola (Brevicoryne brassicae)]WAI18999.1 MAG: preprotein translocase subunit SecE [Buchnera aphidicola (Brevicoryne brassicae)]
MNKNNQNQKESQVLEKIKWLSISILFILSFLTYYYFYKMELYIRLVIMFFLIICAIRTLLWTVKGKHIISYIRVLKKEIKKIIWPEYKETLYTTLIVITITIFISFILWILDNIIFRLIAFIISLRF